MNKATTGPLGIALNKEKHPSHIYDTLGRTVCQFPTVHKDCNEGRDARKGSPYTLEAMQANARLIAAAPDLLQTLQTAQMYLFGIVKRDAHLQELLETIQSTLEKATTP